MKQRVDELIAYSDAQILVFDPSLSVVVNQSHTYPTYYKAEPTKNALREAIVEQDIGPGGASWTPQISLRNGSNHGDLEWLNGGGVLQKCHMSNGKSKIYIKNKKIEAGDERHSSNTLAPFDHRTSTEAQPYQPFCF